MSSMSSGPGSRLRIVVLGYIVRFPLGGMAWHYLNYVLGLSRLGHDVYYLESGGESDWSCYDPVQQINTHDPSAGIAFARQTFSRLGLGDRWGYYDARSDRWLGPIGERAAGICRSADLLINVSGANVLQPSQMSIPARVLIDTDPAFTQIRHLTDDNRRRAAALHTHFLSFGERLGRDGSSVPDDGFAWRATRQPVVLDAWNAAPHSGKGPFTTVMQWDSYAVHEYNGKAYGMKSQSFVDYLNLPQHVPDEGQLEIALGGTSAPRGLLSGQGWHLRNPLSVTQTPWTYQRYIQESGAEFAVAKHGYVSSVSGWFSERSACYLASGRPVVLQDTGFSQVLPTGEGLLAFSSPEQAASAIRAVNRDFHRHSRAAREIAEEYFDSNKVLNTLIDDVRPLAPSAAAPRRSAS